jgi:hypothetical protein
MSCRGEFQNGALPRICNVQIRSVPLMPPREGALYSSALPLGMRTGR